MNSTKVTSTSGTDRRKRVSTLNWQVEIQQLYRNYFVMDEILGRSIGLPSETVNRYVALQQVITTMMERLLDDLDRSEPSQAPGCETDQLLKRHAVVIRQLNTRVYGIMNEVTA